MFRVPSLFWISASDRALGGVCAAGVFAAVLLIQGIAPRVMLSLVWVCYLSLVSVGGSFTAYQWDDLLLETGLLAILLAPAGRWPRYATTPRPSPLAVFLLRLLLFKLMFLSGIVKLLSKDDAWRSLKALGHHFTTQPIPTPLAAYAAKLPDPVLQAATLAVLVIEIGVPFVMFFLREAWARWVVFGCFAGLQVLIALTGNYGFFNLLTLALCLLVLTDDDLRRFVPGPLRSFFRDRPRRATPFWAGLVIALCALPLVTLTVLQMANTARGRHLVPRAGRAALDAIRPLRSCNGYGLFARMTTRRDDLWVEATVDGATWERYRFRYLPEPCVVPPGHLPRLDWAAWFAAAQRRDPTWFGPLADGLLRGSPAVRGLFATDPFAKAGPPRDVRIRSSRAGQVIGAWSRRRR